jgi:hypothetical protein
VFLRDAREVTSSVRSRLAPIAWNAERQRIDEELYRSPIEQTSQSTGRSDEANSNADISALSSVEGWQMDGPIVDTPVGDVAIFVGDRQQAKGGERLDNCDPECAQSWNLKLREARAGKKLSRPAAASRLGKQGIQITKHAIKKHEEGKSKPRPAVRRAYATIYDVSQQLLFPGE